MFFYLIWLPVEAYSEPRQISKIKLLRDVDNEIESSTTLAKILKLKGDEI